MLNANTSDAPKLPKSISSHHQQPTELPDWTFTLQKFFWGSSFFRVFVCLSHNIGIAEEDDVKGKI